MNSVSNIVYRSYFERFSNKVHLTQAEETEILISELARVTGGEKALIGECGGLLSKTYASQVSLTMTLHVMYY